MRVARVEAGVSVPDERPVFQAQTVPRRVVRGLDAGDDPEDAKQQGDRRPAPPHACT